MSMRKSKKPKQTMLERKCRFEGKCEIHGCEKKKKKNTKGSYIPKLSMLMWQNFFQPVKKYLTHVAQLS